MKRMLPFIRRTFFNYTTLALIVYAVVACTHRDTFRTYEKKHKMLMYDMAGYYAYLPSLLTDGDLKFNFLDTTPRQSARLKILNKNGDTLLINRYSIGPSLLMAPFFMLGHADATLRGQPNDGLNSHYFYWINTGCILYVIFALLFLSRILRRYFDDLPVAATLLALGLGTNLLFYTVHEFLMSHVYSFFLFAAAFYLAIRWYESRRKIFLFLLAFIFGFIFVCRIPNILFIIFILLWGVGTKDELSQRLQFLWEEKLSIGLSLFFFCMPILPQIYYWYSTTGYLFLNSYPDHAFHFSSPMILEVLIGFRKGWLIYSPILWFGWIGLLMYFKAYRSIMVPVLVYLAINIYVVSSWNWWWYGGSFGMRALIEASIPLSIPMALVFQKIGEKRVWSHITAVVFSFLIGLNIFQTYQYDKGIIHHQAMTRKAYWAVFGVIHPAHPEIMQQRDKNLMHPNRDELDRKVYRQTIW